MNEAVLGTQISAAGIAVYLIQWLKNTNKIPWVSASTDKLNRVLSVILAALATVGVNVQFDQAAGSLLITGLSLTTALTLGWKLVEQFVFQELIYRGAAKK